MFYIYEWRDSDFCVCKVIFNNYSEELYKNSV